MSETTMARVAHSLAAQFPPDWVLPPDVQWFALPDRVLAEYCRLTRIETYQALRSTAVDRLEAIENRTYYNLGDFGVWGLNNPQRFRFDRAEMYHRLWWLDMFIAMYTKPSAEYAQ